MVDQTLSRPVQCLNILLFQALLRHEAHVGLLHCRTDGFGVIRVILLPTHKPLYILIFLPFDGNEQAKYGGMEVSDAKRLKALEDENRRLAKLLAESMLDNAALKDILEKNG
jgi:hypothetical protein